MDTIDRLEYFKLIANKGVKQRKHPTDEEHRIQCACVKWFRATYPELAHALFAVPNGGKRDSTTGAKLKAEGALAGVADLILLVTTDHYGALLIEMKTPKGKQSPSQIEWERVITQDRYKYIVCRSLDDFVVAITRYINNQK
jgi:hypothetical protein